VVWKLLFVEGVSTLDYGVYWGWQLSWKYRKEYGIDKLKLLLLLPRLVCPSVRRTVDIPLWMTVDELT
jgi:hypothetical protein